MNGEGLSEFNLGLGAAPVVATDEDTDASPPPDSLETAFYSFENFSIPGKDSDLMQSLAAHLAHAVGRHPHDLKSHVARVYLHHRHKDEEGLYSALLDLFIALEGKGLPLRTRLLNGSRSQLSAPHYAALKQYLVTPIAETNLPRGRTAVLPKGLTGFTRVVDEIVTVRETIRDPLIEAREFIEYFQLDDARLVLEDALLTSPEREDLQAELLELYRATDDHQQWQIMRNKLAHLLGTLPRDWSEFNRADGNAPAP